MVEAAAIRLRPILMTSFATIFGVLPIAIGLGAGAESRRPLGIAVVGGMFFSTFLTLVLVPVVYMLLGRFTKVKKRDGGGPENVVRPVAEKVQGLSGVADSRGGAVPSATSPLSGSKGLRNGI